VRAATRLSYLRVALILVGLIFIFGVYPLMMALWPSGWRWSPNQAQYEQMILGVYATLGVFLLIASRNPLRHLSLIWFTVFSSIVHAGIMTVQALRMPSEHGHLFGDVPALFIVAALLAFLTPRGADATQASA
jgi:ABC-type transport system involved in cytochrome c biogenesis permease subunit